MTTNIVWYVKFEIEGAKKKDHLIDTLEDLKSLIRELPDNHEVIKFGAIDGEETILLFNIKGEIGRNFA